jgi:methionyl-tRNA formyltransferase
MLLKAAEKGRRSIPRVEQELDRRSYFGKEVPQNGAISWSLPARRVVDFVRACDYFPFASPWGSPTAHACGAEISVLKASLTHVPTSEPPGAIAGAPAGAVKVATGDEWVLVRRIRAGGQVGDAAEILEPGTKVCDGTAGPARAEKSSRAAT